MNKHTSATIRRVAAECTTHHLRTGAFTIHPASDMRRVPVDYTIRNRGLGVSALDSAAATCGKPTSYIAASDGKTGKHGAQPFPVSKGYHAAAPAGIDYGVGHDGWIIRVGACYGNALAIEINVLIVCTRRNDNTIPGHSRVYRRLNGWIIARNRPSCRRCLRPYKQYQNQSKC